MNEVTRYDCTSDGQDMWPEKDGDWVSFEDYAALQQKLDTLLAENKILDGAIGAIADAYETGMAGLLAKEIDTAVNIETPATDATLNEVRAGAVASLWRESLRDVGRVLSEIGAYHDASEAGGIVHDEIKERVDDRIAQLRASSTKGGV